MLQFYLLPNEADKPLLADLRHVPPVGSLTEEQFTYLQERRLLESRLDFCTDFRWSNHTVRIKLQILLHQFPNLRPATTAEASPEQQLLLILLNASAQHTGIYAIAH